MKLIDQSVQFIENKNVYKHLELCGRIAYKSEDKINESSYKKFLNIILSNHHESVLEHSNIIFQINNVHTLITLIKSFDEFKFTKLTEKIDANSHTVYTLSANFRCLLNIFRRHIVDKNIYYMYLLCFKQYEEIFKEI